MNRRAWISLGGVVFTALISGIVLWSLMVKGSSLGSLGLAGVFLASMLSHLTVVARDMFIPLFLPLTSVYHPSILGFSAGMGGAIGEVTTYFLGWGLTETLEERTSAEDRIAKWINRYGLWAVLLVALTPLPDTPIVILAGSRRLPFRKLLLVEILGKTALYSMGAFLGGMFFLGLKNTIGGYASSIFMVVGSVVFTFAVTWRPSREWIFGLVENLID